jgi:hypothetical protein
MEHEGKVEVWLHSFLTLALHVAEWSTSHPQYFTPAREPRYPLNKRLGGPQSQSECYGAEKNLLFLLGSEALIIQPVAFQHYWLYYTGSIKNMLNPIIQKQGILNLLVLLGWQQFLNRYKNVNV